MPYANVGVVGKPDGNWFFDDDGGVLSEYENLHGKIQTYRARSVSGGTHLHLKQNNLSRQMGNISGVDEHGAETWSARVSNRYVVTPGSSAHPENDDRKPEKFYEAIDNIPVIEAPESFIEFLTAKANRAPKTVEISSTPQPDVKIPHHGIHPYMLSQAGKLRRMNMPPEALEPALIALVKENCEEPIDIVKVKAMAASILKYPAGQNTDLILISQQPTTGTLAEWSVIQPLDDLLSPVKPFDLNFLPTSIQPWSKDVSERMGVPLDFAGICSLVVLAGCTGRRVFVYPKEFDKDWKESLALSGAVVAHSGRIKTPTWKMFTNIVVEMEMDWKREYSKKIGQYTKDLENWKGLQKANKKLTEKNPGTSVMEAPEPIKPVSARCVLLNDATPEAMHVVMEENPEGLFYYRDELSGWVAELDKDGREGQRGIFLAAMNGDDAYSVNRIGRGHVFAIMCASVFGGFQPDMLIDFLSENRNVSSGMIPRFSLMVWPDEHELPMIDRPANADAKSGFRNIVRTLMVMKAESIQMHFDSEAQKMFNDWLVKHNHRTNTEENTGKQSHLSKYKGTLPKIAGLLQLIDLVALGGTFTGAHHIDASHLRKALGLLDYLESHMHRIYDSRRESLQQTESLLVRKIKTHSIKDGMTARDITRKNWHGLDDTEHVEAALMNLAEKGWVRESLPINRPGRPTVRWDVNPAASAR